MYKFNDQNVQTFEDNYKFMGEVPFSIYFDFETTCGKKSFEFDNESELWLVCYAFAVAFNTMLKLDRIFVETSFSHTYNDFSDINYFPNELLHYFNPMNARQLKGCAKNVYKKKTLSQRNAFLWT